MAGRNVLTVHDILEVVGSHDLGMGNGHDREKYRKSEEVEKYESGTYERTEPEVITGISRSSQR